MLDINMVYQCSCIYISIDVQQYLYEFTIRVQRVLVKINAKSPKPILVTYLNIPTHQPHASSKIRQISYEFNVSNFPFIYPRYFLKSRNSKYIKQKSRKSKYVKHQFLALTHEFNVSSFYYGNLLSITIYGALLLYNTRLFKSYFQVQNLR